MNSEKITQEMKEMELKFEEKKVLQVFILFIFSVRGPIKFFFFFPQFHLEIIQNSNIK